MPQDDQLRDNDPGIDPWAYTRAGWSANVRHPTFEEESSYQARIQGKRLRVAAEKNLVDDMMDALRKGADLNSGDGEGRRALHYAARSGQVEAIVLLLEQKADVNAPHNYGGMPVDEAEDWAVRCEDSNTRSRCAIAAHHMLSHGGCRSDPAKRSDQKQFLRRRAMLEKRARNLDIPIPWNGDRAQSGLSRGALATVLEENTAVAWVHVPVHLCSCPSDAPPTAMHPRAGASSTCNRDPKLRTTVEESRSESSANLRSASKCIADFAVETTEHASRTGYPARDLNVPATVKESLANLQPAMDWKERRVQYPWSNRRYGSEIDSEYLNLVKGELLLVRSAPLDEGSSQKWAFGWSVQGQRYGWFPLV